MIRADQAHKVYDRNTRVIRKGDPGWKSDHPARRGEATGTNPLSLMDQGIRRRSHGPVDPACEPERFTVGTKWLTDDKVDAFEWIVAERAGKRYWRLVCTHRNGAR